MSQSAQPSRIVIVGASLAGGSAAVALREQGYTGELTLIGDEVHRPYERPPLSKALMQGEVDEPDWVADEAFWADKATLLVGTLATRIDRDRKVVAAGGDDHPYDRLIIATGLDPTTAGASRSGTGRPVHLRTLDDALTLRERFTSGAQVVVVGAGWIGCEVSASARKHDAHA